MATDVYKVTVDEIVLSPTDGPVTDVNDQGGKTQAELLAERSRLGKKRTLLIGYWPNKVTTLPDSVHGTIRRDGVDTLLGKGNYDGEDTVFYGRDRQPDFVSPSGVDLFGIGNDGSIRKSGLPFSCGSKVTIRKFSWPNSKPTLQSTWQGIPLGKKIEDYPDIHWNKIVYDNWDKFTVRAENIFAPTILEKTPHGAGDMNLPDSYGQTWYLTDSEGAPITDGSYRPDNPRDGWLKNDKFKQDIREVHRGRLAGGTWKKDTNAPCGFTTKWSRVVAVFHSNPMNYGKLDDVAAFTTADVENGVFAYEPVTEEMSNAGFWPAISTAMVDTLIAADKHGRNPLTSFEGKSRTMLRNEQFGPRPGFDMNDKGEWSAEKYDSYIGWWGYYYKLPTTTHTLPENPKKLRKSEGDIPFGDGEANWWDMYDDIDIWCQKTKPTCDCGRKNVCRPIESYTVEKFGLLTKPIAVGFRYNEELYKSDDGFDCWEVYTKHVNEYNMTLPRAEEMAHRDRYGDPLYDKPKPKLELGKKCFLEYECKEEWGASGPNKKCVPMGAPDQSELMQGYETCYDLCGSLGDSGSSLKWCPEGSQVDPYNDGTYFVSTGGGSSSISFAQAISKLANYDKLTIYPLVDILGDTDVGWKRLMKRNKTYSASVTGKGKINMLNHEPVKKAFFTFNPPTAETKAWFVEQLYNNISSMKYKQNSYTRLSSATKARVRGINPCGYLVDCGKSKITRSGKSITFQQFMDNGGSFGASRQASIPGDSEEELSSIASAETNAHLSSIILETKEPDAKSDYKVTINQVRPCSDHEEVSLDTADQKELFNIRNSEGVTVVKYVLGWRDKQYNETTNDGINTTFYAQPRSHSHYGSLDQQLGDKANAGGVYGGMPSLFCGTKVTIEPHTGTPEDAGLVIQGPKHIVRPNFIVKVKEGEGDLTLPDSEGFLPNETSEYKQDLAESMAFDPGYPSWIAPIRDELPNPKLMGDYSDPDVVAAVFVNSAGAPHATIPGFAGEYELVTQEMVDSSAWKTTGQGLLTSKWAPKNGFFGYYYAGADKTTTDRFTTSENETLLVDPLKFGAHIDTWCSPEVPNCECGKKWVCKADNPAKDDTLACTGTYTKSANEYVGETLEGGLNKVQQKSNCDRSKGSCFQEFECEGPSVKNQFQRNCKKTGNPHQTGDAPVLGYEECVDLCGPFADSNDSSGDVYCEDCSECEACPSTCYECKVYADGIEVKTVELGKEGEPCRCKLEISGFYATRCDGQIQVGGDVGDKHGTWAHPFGFELDDNGESKFSVKCAPVNEPTELT